MLFPHGPRVPGAVSGPPPSQAWGSLCTTVGFGPANRGAHDDLRGPGSSPAPLKPERPGYWDPVPTKLPSYPFLRGEGTQRAFQISPPGKCMFISAGTPVYPTPPVTLGPVHGRGGWGGVSAWPIAQSCSRGHWAHVTRQVQPTPTNWAGPAQKCLGGPAGLRSVTYLSDRVFSSPRSPMGGEQRPLVFHCRPLHFEAIVKILPFLLFSQLQKLDQTKAHHAS